MGCIVPSEDDGYRCITCEDYGLDWPLCTHMSEAQREACARAEAKRMSTSELIETANALSKRHADCNSGFTSTSLMRWRAMEAEEESRRFTRNGQHFISKRPVKT